MRKYIAALVLAVPALTLSATAADAGELDPIIDIADLGKCNGSVDVACSDEGTFCTLWIGDSCFIG